MVDERIGDDLKTKLFSWYICTVCSEGGQKTPCVAMFPRGMPHPKNEITPKNIKNFDKKMIPLINCLIKNYKQPRWVRITPNELITMVNSDPYVRQCDKLHMEDTNNERTEQIVKKQNRFSNIDLIDN